MAEDRTGSLRAAKLKGLVRLATGGELLIEDGGAAARGVLDDPDEGPSRAFFYPPANGAVRSLGAALIWASRLRADQLNLVVDNPSDAGDLARRANLFSGPDPETPMFSDGIVLWLAGTDEMTVARAKAHTPVPPLSEQESAFAEVIEAAGARAVHDHGYLIAEVAGLEVGRVVDRGGWRLEVGIGEVDREFHSLIKQSADPETALRDAVNLVLPHRRPGVPSHPLGRLNRDRWLRSHLLDSPGLAGASELHAIAPLRRLDSVVGSGPLGNGPSAAAGQAAAGGAVVVVCSVGVDPDLGPEAADYRLRHDPEAALVVVVPQRDRYPVTEQLVGRIPNSELLCLDAPWDQITGPRD